jgi:hypothetical protein
MHPSVEINVIKGLFLLIVILKTINLVFAIEITNFMNIRIQKVICLAVFQELFNY